MDKKELAMVAGMTEAEAEIWDLLAQTASKWFRLIERTGPSSHPMEREEVCHEVHHLQEKLMGRMFMRNLYKLQAEEQNEKIVSRI